MKKNILTISIIIILLLIAAYFFFEQKIEHKTMRLDAFAIADTASLSKITITKDNQTVSFEREGDSWQLNGKYVARDRSMYYFLKSLTLLRIKSPVSRDKTDTVKQLLKTKGIESRFFSRGELIKHFRVINTGNSACMMAADSERPYLVHIPGINFNAAELFKTSPGFWRDNTVFNYDTDQIKEVSVKYKENPENSFNLKMESADNAVLEYQGEKTKPLNPKAVERYLSYFRDIRYNTLVDSLARQKIDSVFASQADYEITVVSQKGVKNTLKLYHIKLPNQQNKEFQYDLNNLYAKSNDEKELYLMKFITVDALLKKGSYFNKE